MKSKLFIIAVTCFLAGKPGSAQNIYDLDKCIATGMENNYSIILSRNKEAVNENNYTLGSAGYLPSLDFTSRYGGTITTTEQRLADGSENLSQGIHNKTATAGVALGWTIFNGFSVQTTYKKLGETQAIGELNTQMAIENLIGRIAFEYAYFVQQNRLYKNLEFALSLSRERVRIDEERYLIGSGSKIQFLQSKVYFNTDSSRLARQNEVLRSSEIRLNELMSVEDLGQTIIINDTTLIVNSGLQFDQLFDETMGNNTALLIAKKNQVVTQYDYKIISARSYPYLTLSSGYNTTLSIYEAGNSTSDLRNGFNYGISLGVNIFDGFNQQRSRKNALIEIDNRTLQYLQIEQEVKSDLLNIYSGYANNLRLLMLEEQNLATATENLEIAFERYKLGNLSGLDLREVQKSLLDAEERVLLVQFQIKSAEISLLQISGHITDYIK